MSAIPLSPLVDAIDDATVQRVHASTLTLDAHIDVRNGFNTPGNDAGGETAGQFDLPKLERGGLDVAVVALAADPIRNDAEGRRLAREQVEHKYAGIARLVADHADRLAFARTSQDLIDIPAGGRHAILLSFLNGAALGEDLTAIGEFHRRGVRLLGLGHLGNNLFVDSSRPSQAFGDVPDQAGGLSELGRRAIAELNRLGIIVDVSQLTSDGVGQVLALSKAPVIASHSAVRGRIDVTRNLSNAELRAIAAQGGVVHVVAFAPYIRANDGSRELFEKEVYGPFGIRPGIDDPRLKLSTEDYQRYQATYRQFSGRRLLFASLVDYLDAVDYAVRLIGIDHVGISSDFNNGGGVTGYADVGEAPNITRELLRRGYGEEEIAKLWGGNFLRVFRQVEQAAGG